MMSKCFSLLLLLLLPSIVYAQVFEHFKIRQSVIDLNEISEPARFNITFPDSGDNSFLINAGLSYKPDKSYLVHGILLEWSGTIEYQRNTAIDKEQNLLSASLSGYIISDFDLIFAGSLNSQLIAKLKSNYQDTARSASVNLKVIPAISKLKFSQFFGPDNFKLLFEPYFGIYYESKLSTVDNFDGDIFRAYGTPVFAIYPFWKKYDCRFILSASRSWWFNIYENNFLTLQDVNDPTLWNISAQIYFTSEKNFGINGSYTNGSNPMNDLGDQEFYQLSLTFKL